MIFLLNICDDLDVTNFGSKVFNTFITTTFLLNICEDLDPTNFVRSLSYLFCNEFPVENCEDLEVTNFVREVFILVLQRLSC